MSGEGLGGERVEMVKNQEGMVMESVVRTFKEIANDEKLSDEAKKTAAILAEEIETVRSKGFQKDLGKGMQNREIPYGVKEKENRREIIVSAMQGNGREVIAGDSESYLVVDQVLKEFTKKFYEDDNLLKLGIKENDPDNVVGKYFEMNVLTKLEGTPVVEDESPNRIVFRLPKKR